MNLPPKKNRGDPILARDWNLLVDAVAASCAVPGAWPLSAKRPVSSTQRTV